MYKERLRIHLIEIPGFNDPSRSAAEVSNEVVSWLSDIYNKNIQLSCIIYLHRISDARWRGSDRTNLAMLQKLCGLDSFPNIILATMFWDNIEPGVGAEREKELVEREYLWGFMLRRGSVVARHSGTRQSALAILEQSLRSRRLLTLQIQREVCIKGVCLIETEAVRQVNEDLLSAQEIHLRDLSRAKEQFQEYEREMKELREREAWIRNALKMGKRGN
jgi:hypothetical protein